MRWLKLGLIANALLALALAGVIYWFLTTPTAFVAQCVPIQGGQLGCLIVPAKVEPK